MKIKSVLALTIFALSTQVNAAGVNLVVNGSFENPDIPTGSYNTYNSILGWTTSGAGVEIRDNVVGTAYDGDQFAELDSLSNSAIFQNVANTVAGQSYLLSFAYSPRIDQLSLTNGISAYWNGVLVDSVTADGGSSNNWTMFNYLVTGTGNDVLQFAAVGTDDSLGGNLDAVSVSAVPLPAAAFLFAPALLGFMGLRRKAKNTIA
tara:strand:+ start:58541 stop:59155 length:615 start_codon:yes stop_codon:yes gene_type:complete